MSSVNSLTTDFQTNTLNISSLNAIIQPNVLNQCAWSDAISPNVRMRLGKSAWEGGILSIPLRTLGNDKDSVKASVYDASSESLAPLFILVIHRVDSNNIFNTNSLIKVDLHGYVKEEATFIIMLSDANKSLIDVAEATYREKYERMWGKIWNGPNGPIILE